MKFLSTLAIGALVIFSAASCKNNPDSGAAVGVNDSTAVSVASPGSIVYLNYNKVMLEYTWAVELSSKFEAKATEVEKEINRKQKNLQGAYSKFQKDYGNGLFTPTVAETKMKKLQNQEAALGKYVQEKTAEIDAERMTMMNQINNAISEFVTKYREENGFAMVLLSEVDLPDDGVITIGNVLAADPKFDITAAVIAGLNAEYKENGGAEAETK